MVLRDGFAFSTQLRVRYAEIDGQRVVFNSRYLEYADVAASEYWTWTGVEQALGDVWRHAEFHIRRAEVDYLRPFVWRDVIDAHVRIERVGRSSVTLHLELTHADTGALHTVITLVLVNVDLPTGRPLPLSTEMLAFLERLA